MPRPLVGICAAVEPASFGPWIDQPAVLLPIAYARAVQFAGGIALMLGGGADLDPASHGADPHRETMRTNPERDRFELSLAREALERDLPLLGVCRGMQVMNVAAGGSLDQHLPERLGH